MVIKVLEYKVLQKKLFYEILMIAILKLIQLLQIIVMIDSLENLLYENLENIFELELKLLELKVLLLILVPN